MDEVRSGGSYLSQSDFRLRFGLGTAQTAEIEVRWPSGTVDRFTARVNRTVVVHEGKSPRERS